MKVYLVMGASLVAHVGILALAFAMRAPEPKGPRTEVVRVLTGHVDGETGAFRATGMHDARIAKK